MTVTIRPALLTGPARKATKFVIEGNLIPFQNPTVAKKIIARGEAKPLAIFFGPDRGRPLHNLQKGYFRHPFTGFIYARRCFSPVRTGSICAFSIFSASAGKAYSTGNSGSRLSLIKGDDSESAHDRQIPIEEGWRSGTHHSNYPKTDIVVAIVRIVVVTIHGPSVVMIVVPRPAPQDARITIHLPGRAIARCAFIIIVPNILTPFPYVAVNIGQTSDIRLFLPHRMSFVA